MQNMRFFCFSVYRKITAVYRCKSALANNDQVYIIECVFERSIFDTVSKTHVVDNSKEPSHETAL